MDASSSYMAYMAAAIASGQGPNLPPGFFNNQPSSGAANNMMGLPPGFQTNQVAGPANNMMGLDLEMTRMAQETVQETLSEEVFTTYKASVPTIPHAQPHPADIVEAGSLAAMALPATDYPLADTIPDDVITSGKLSSLQLEGVIYACTRHQMVLPNSCRAGFFIGDGAGVGKGRQIAGIILDNFARGRTRHVWFSISTDLKLDAERDLRDIGCYVKVIEGCQQLDRETKVFGLPPGFKEGVIFSTYATLVSSVQKGVGASTSRQSRLDQLINWCGGQDFDGCLIFDECHKAKHFVPGKEKNSTKVALAVATIQRLLPKARVVYCSATGVTDVKNMAFMERLGLWGSGAAFKDFEQFLEAIQRRGLGVAEMLAMEMKGSGMYISRGLSFRQAEFVTVEVNLTPQQVKTYDMAAHVWNELRQSLTTAVARTGTNNPRMWSTFWSSHQRFFKQLCMGMKVPAIVQEAKESLEKGYCVVIGLQTTGEASLECELSKHGGQVSGFVSLCKEIYTRFVQQHFPTIIQGREEKEDFWCRSAKDLLLGFADKIGLPNSPLDEIIDQLGGTQCVAEMTGRRGRVVRKTQKSPPQYALRDSDTSGDMDSLNIREKTSFMDGRKLVSIISDAASTGISLHADMRAANQRRRVHITLELPWSADKAVQQMGRSHRSNQSSGPLYKLVTTSLGGERRFAAAVARRLQSLGALTKGDRRAATGADLSEFNFDTPYGRTALRNMYYGICHGEMVAGVSLDSVTQGKYQFGEFNTAMQDCLSQMGVVEEGSGNSVKDKDSGMVGRFLNRILGLSVERQNLIFRYFSKCLDANIGAARREGRYNEGLVDITGSSVDLVGDPREVFHGVHNGTNTTRHVVLSVDRGMDWDTAMERAKNHGKEKDGFYCSRREVRGRRLYILATQKENSTHLFKVARPNTGVSSFDEEISEILSRYSHVAEDRAEHGWKQQYEEASQHCIHGPNCKNGQACTVGSRCYRVSLLCGGIVTLMSLLERTVAQYQAKLQLSKVECNLRVVRVELRDGRRIVGLRYPEVLIPLAEKAMQEQNLPESIIQRIKNQPTILSNGMLALPSQSAPPPLPANRATSAVIEPACPVIRKCLSRATTPPVTIKNFFKPCSTIKRTTSTSTVATSQSDSSVEAAGQSNGDATDCTDPDQSGASQASQSSGGAMDPDQSGASQASQSSGVIQSGSDQSQEEETEKPETETALSTVDSATDVVVLSQDSSSTQGSSFDSENKFGSSQTCKNTTNLEKLSVKRPLGSSSANRPAKRQKSQKSNSLMTMFKKATQKEEVSKLKKQTCPICNVVMKPGTTNGELNQHIDNCLIE
ncbi:PREDICTED: protein FORGETTER 1-like [Branchiostoma belcheri]|uniref:Protein strawberry notch homolog 2 n=1 Tax=Branchiostoma belcheri TaxID=7741 RepID=A0A6P5AM02_BRABE|nr:PREDICTED: protein FORGETTER 1-like [Branchiostoma belcheri]